MANSLIVHRGSSAFVDGSTRYTHIGGGFYASNSAIAQLETPIRDAGTFSNLFVYVATNTASVTSTITLQKNQVDTALTVSYTADQTGIKEDTSNTVSFVATDEANLEITVPTEVGTNTLTAQIFSMQFAPTTTTDCLSILHCNASGSVSHPTDSTTFYFVPNGLIAISTTEANNKYRVRATFTASDFYVHVPSNSRTTDTVLRTRVNGANGGQSVTYATTQTGVKEDTVNTDALVAGDDYNYSLTTGTGAGEAFFVAKVGTSVISTNSIFVCLVGDNDGDAIAFNVTAYYGAAGVLVDNTTEANSQVYPRFTFTTKELGAFVSANTIATSDTVVTLMDNGAASSVTVSYAAAQTGLKNDSTNTAEITSGTDEIDYRVVTPNTSGSLTFTWIGILGDTSVGAPPSVVTPLHTLLFMGVG